MGYGKSGPSTYDELLKKQVRLENTWSQLTGGQSTLGQIRIEGVLEKVDHLVSDKYFNARPRRSQLGAWASAQSQQIKNR